MDDYIHNPIESTSDTRAVTDAELQAILADHQLWLDSEGREGHRANLRNADLRGVNLARYNLSEASLRGADLSGAHFAQANLQHADLAEARVDNTSFHGAMLSAAILTNLQGRQTDFTEADLTQANLSGSKLERTKFVRTHLSAANLRECVLESVDFLEADLSSAQMRGAQVRYGNLTQTKLQHADARDVDFGGAMMDHTQVEGTQLRGALLMDAQVKQVDFTVALEVPQDYLNQLHLVEKQRIDEESERLRKWQATLDLMQKKTDEARQGIEAEKQSLAARALNLDTLRGGVENAKKWFIILTSLWGLITVVISLGTLALVSQIDYNNLNWFELGILFTVLVVVLALMIVTMVQSSVLSRLLRQQSQADSPPPMLQRNSKSPRIS